MVNAVNKLIEDLASQKIEDPENVDTISDARKRKLELLILNLKRIKDNPDLAKLQIDLLITYTQSLQKYYEKKISYREYLKSTNNIDSKEINKKINLVIEQLNRISTAVYLEPTVRELKKEKVNDTVIKEAMELPQEIDTISKVKMNIINNVHNFGNSPLDKEQIFKLILLRIATHAHSENIPVPEVNRIRRHYESSGEPSSYEQTLDLTKLIKEFTVRLNTIYPNHKKLFLARDGIILYEAQITMYRTSCDIIYISRDTIKEYFDLFSKDLDSVISKQGVNNSESIIEELKEIFMSKYNSNEHYKTIFESIIKYIGPYFNHKTVFVDSSSKSIPIILCAMSRIFYPNFDFKAYFFSTIYTDPNVGFILGKNDNKLDMLADYVEFDQAHSSMLPWYIQKFIPIPNKRMKQQQAYMTHLVLQSTLHSSFI